MASGAMRRAVFVALSAVLVCCVASSLAQRVVCELDDNSFSDLAGTEFTYTDHRSNNTWHIQPCHATETPCSKETWGSSGVFFPGKDPKACGNLGKIESGEWTKLHPDTDKQEVIVTYISGSQCRNTTYSLSIHFTCDRAAKQPVLHKVYPSAASGDAMCHHIADISTKLACPENEETQTESSTSSTAMAGAHHSSTGSQKKTDAAAMAADDSETTAVTAPASTASSAPAQTPTSRASTAQKSPSSSSASSTRLSSTASAPISQKPASSSTASKAAPVIPTTQKEGGISGFWVFMFILVFGFGLYVLVGCVYNREVSGVSGWEAMPNHDFWCELPGHMKDAVNYCVTCGRGSRPVGYSHTVEHDVDSPHFGYGSTNYA